jgi:glucose-6-phosphate 1-dehydrogenase
LNYSSRYSEMVIPDAYESLLSDILRGDQSNFVRTDEL